MNPDDTRPEKATERNRVTATTHRDERGAVETIYRVDGQPVVGVPAVREATGGRA